MVDILQSKVIGPNKLTWYMLVGDKTDTKPTGEFPAGSGHTIANGSRFFENKTEIRYEYKNGSWNPVGQVDVKLVDKTITENGEYDPADDDADGYSSVSVDVELTLENKTMTPTTSEQTIIADEGYDALGTVTIEAVTAAIDSNITAENIKDGVSILGVAGSMASGVAFSTTPAAFTLIKNIRNLNMVIPDGVTSIGLNAFNSCTGLMSINIPSSVTSIGGSAFSECTGLTSVDIPSSVTSIGTAAFYGCTNITQITIHKAQGSISGAPWGALNATVTWTG